MSEENKKGKISEAIHEAQSIIESAELKAARILEKAEVAYEDAKSSGKKEGQEIGEKKVIDTSVRLVQMASESSDILSEEIAKLAMKVVEKFLEAELKLEPKRAVTIVKNALKQSIPGNKVTLLVNPADADVVRSYPGMLVPDSCELEIVEQEDIKRGGCLLRTDFGEVDMTVDSVISNFGKKLGVGND